MANYSAKEMIEFDDLESAYSRYQTATARWKAHWWETVETIFNQSVKWAQKYILDPVEKILRKVGETIQKVFRPRVSKNGSKINFKGDTARLDEDGTQKLYLIKFYEPGNDVPIFTKIGTSARTVRKRLMEEIRDYSPKWDIARADVEAIIDCGEMPAESYESFLRALFIKKYPGKWIKNDRFVDTDIPAEVFNKACAKFTALSAEI